MGVGNLLEGNLAKGLELLLLPANALPAVTPAEVWAEFAAPSTPIVQQTEQNNQQGETEQEGEKREKKKKMKIQLSWI